MAFALAAAAIGSQLIGGLVQKNASDKATSAQTSAAKNQLAFQQNVFDTVRSDNETVRFSRDAALGQLMAELGLPVSDVQISAPEMGTREIQAPDRVIPGAGGRGNSLTIPGGTTTEEYEIAPGQYFTPQAQNGLTDADQFAIDESIKAAQIGSGGQLGGNALRALTERTQSIAALSRDNRLNRLASLAGLAQNATTANQSQQISSAGKVGNALNNVGAARASGFVNGSNAVTGTLQNINNTLQNYGGYGGSTGGFTGTPSPGVAPGSLPLHLQGF